jgi:hypothetical protein
MSPNLYSLSLFLFLPVCAGLYAYFQRGRGRPGQTARATPVGDAAEREELRAQVHDTIREVPPRPPLLSMATSTPLSLVVEARLLSGCPSQALLEAEDEVLNHPEDGGGFVALAKALLYCQKDDEARAALRWAQRLGADDPEFDYLRARLSQGDLSALRLCLRACRREPGYPEALYLCARLCLHLGFREEGEQLLRHIAPLMHLSVERLAYRRDLRALLGERHSVAAQQGPARRLFRRLGLGSADKANAAA